MKAVNYLGSVLSQKTANIPSSTLIRCLELILKFYEKSQAKQATKEDGDIESLAGSAHRIFNHCFYQNLALIFASKHQVIKNVDRDVFDKIYKLLFQKKFGSLEYSSPFILEELLECTKDVDEDIAQMQHIAKKVKTLMDS